MKVKINKETGLGEYVESEYPYAWQSSLRKEIVKDNPPLPVIFQSGEILTEGTFECEKVWQWYYKSQIVDGGIWSDVDLDCTPNHKTDTREVYRVVLPTQPDVKETVTLAAIELFERGSYKNDQQLKSTYVIGAEFGANWHKQQVIEVINKWWDKDTTYDELIKVINDI